MRVIGKVVDGGYEQNEGNRVRLDLFDYVCNVCVGL